MTDWSVPDLRYPGTAEEFRREVYGEWAEMVNRCENERYFPQHDGYDRCPNVATLDILDPDNEVIGHCCVPCSRAYPNLRYRRSAVRAA